MRQRRRTLMWAFHLLANVSNHGLRLDRLTNCLAEFGDTYIALYRLKTFAQTVELRGAGTAS